MKKNEDFLYSYSPFPEPKVEWEINFSHLLHQNMFSTSLSLANTTKCWWCLLWIGVLANRWYVYKIVVVAIRKPNDKKEGKLQAWHGSLQKPHVEQLNIRTICVIHALVVFLLLGLFFSCPGHTSFPCNAIDIKLCIFTSFHFNLCIHSLRSRRSRGGGGGGV